MARATTRRCSAGLPRTMSPAFPPQPKPISEIRSSVLPTWRYSMVASLSSVTLADHTRNGQQKTYVTELALLLVQVYATIGHDWWYTRVGVSGELHISKGME